MNTLLKRSAIVLLGLVAAVVFYGSNVFAQEGPSQAEIDAKAAANTPGAAEIQQFQKEFGGPPDSFPAPTITKPQFEQPGTISDEVKKYVSDKDLVAVYCAMTKWKSGQFFSAMDAVKKYVIEPTQQVKTDFSLDITVPDVDGLKTEGQKKVDGICGATTVADAEKLSREFAQWGQQDTQGQFDDMRNKMQEQLKVKSDALRDKITKELQPFIDEQKSSIQKDIQAEADSIVERKKGEINARLKGAKSAPNVDALKAEITSAVESGVRSKIDSKKAEMQAKVTAKVQELVGPEKAKFEKIGELFNNVDGKINDYIKANESQYEKYKIEAFALRKKLVMDILDKNMTEGIAKIDAAAADMDAAHKEDPSVPTAGELKSQLQQDRKALEAKLDAALEAGDENAFQQALNDFRVKWETMQREGEKAMQQSVSKVCTVALAQFDNANKQMDPGIQKIKTLQTKCSNSTTDECLKVNEYSSRFETILSKFSDLKTEMNLATSMCKTPDTADRKNMIALMNKIKSDAEDVKVYGKALEAEKDKMLADTAAQACSQALPQLDAAQTEIQKNDLTSLQNNINRCKGKTTEECKVVNNLSGGVIGLKADITAFNSEVTKAKALCSKAATEDDLKTLSDILNSLKANGEDLRAEAKDLQVKQSEQMSEKILCRSVVPQMETAKQQISAGLLEMNGIKSGCSGKTDERCKVINENGAKFDKVTSLSKNVLGKIGEVNGKCAVASADSLDQGLLDLLDGLQKDRDELNKNITDVKELEALAGKNAGVTIEAEMEVSTSLLPRTESWHSIKGRSGESWRPAMFGTGYWYLSRGGESLSYKFTAPKDGTYNVWVRDYVDNFQARGVRRITMNFDGKNYGTFGETSVPVPAGNKIGVFAWHKVGSGVVLKTGAHAMKITKESTTAGAAILDSFYLTTGGEAPSEK
jgi:tetratricopeptide (TPR) repeat protein